MIYLSLCSMLSVSAALYAFIWWLFCTNWTDIKQILHDILWIVCFTSLVSLFTWYSGGDGISYFIRVTTVFLIAAYTYRSQNDGDILDVSVWAAGNRYGFEIGLIGEMALSTIRVIREDIAQIRMAMHLKGQKLTITSLSSVLSLELFILLSRAMQQGDLLLSRGYRNGGTHTPEFLTGRGDIFRGFLAIPAGFFLFLPFEDLFKYLLPY